MLRLNSRLQSDCEHCFGLCCVALPYAKSADFAFNKDGGVPCRNLGQDNRCGIHEHLREKGFNGCVTYECFGAGQHVSQHIYEGIDWRGNAERAKQMFEVLPIVQQLHEMLYYLDQSLNLEEALSIHEELRELYESTLELTKLHPEQLLSLDIPSHRAVVNEYLLNTSILARKAYASSHQKLKKHYLGANLKGANMRGMNVRGTLMIAANLQKADLRNVDFIGADLRDADLSGANLTGAIFLTQAQVNSAKGNVHTRLPRYLKAPDHWVS